MFIIEHPAYGFRFKTERGRNFIFDIVRKKHVVATPEEIVRQHIIHYLVFERKISKSLLAVEMSLELNGLRKRCDIVVYNQLSPVMIVECKAPSIKLNQDVFEQIARYNMKLKVPFLFVTNGDENYCCKIDFKKGSYQFLNDVPDVLGLKEVG